MKLSDKVKTRLAEQIGVEEEDIKDDDMLIDDLHMSASDISDFFHDLEDEGLNINKIDFDDIKTVEDLREAVSSQEED